MPYITMKKSQRSIQLSFDDLMMGVDERLFANLKSTNDTMTWKAGCVKESLHRKMHYRKMYDAIFAFNQKYSSLIAVEDKASLYRSFKIPKRSGGLRQIDAPNDELMKALRELKDILENKFYFTYHTCSFAYVPGRCTIDAVRRHQKNGSRWVLKTDLSKFFPNTTQEWLFRMLYQTFPLSEYIRYDYGYKEAFEKALSLCFLRGGLPQGTPTSPMLTNQMMIPIDYAINKMCHAETPYLCYTRYADDMDFSSKYDFKWVEVVSKVGKILNEDFGAPFTFNKEKIHYGSTAGRNWMLGVMLNQDGNITVGHENKKVFKTSLFAFGNAIKDGHPWSVEDTQHLMGLSSYYLMVEKEAITELMKKYSQKFGFDLVSMMKKIIKGEPVA